MKIIGAAVVGYAIGAYTIYRYAWRLLYEPKEA